MTSASHPSLAMRIAGAIVVVVFGIWAGMRVYSSRALLHPGGAGSPSAVRVPVGEASPPTMSDFNAGFDPAVPTPAKIPERLPDFSLGDSAGRPTPIAKWAGKSLILNFWATWCAPCRREIPLSLIHIYIKQDAGGLADIEFLVQYWVLASAGDQPQLLMYSDNIRQLEGLAAAGVVDADVARWLTQVNIGYRTVLHHLCLLYTSRCV